MLTPRKFQIMRRRMNDFYFDTEKQFLELIRIMPLIMMMKLIHHDCITYYKHHVAKWKIVYGYYVTD